MFIGEERKNFFFYSCLASRFMTHSECILHHITFCGFTLCVGGFMSTQESLSICDTTNFMDIFVTTFLLLKQCACSLSSLLSYSIIDFYFTVVYCYELHFTFLEMTFLHLLTFAFKLLFSSFVKINIFIAETNYNIRFHSLLYVVLIYSYLKNKLCTLFHVKLMLLLWLYTRPQFIRWWP